MVRETMRRADQGSALHGPTIARAKADYLAEVVHARSLSEWRRHSGWVGKFLAFAHTVRRESGLPPAAEKELLADNALARYFLAGVAAERKGRTRTAAARRALSLERGRLGAPTLNADLSIRDVVRAARQWLNTKQTLAWNTTNKALKILSYLKATRTHCFT